MIIYVSGPMSAENRAAIEHNVEIGMVAALDLIERGHTPVVPHLTQFLADFAEREGRPVAYERWMACDLELIERCDAMLYLAPSPGADREMAHARKCGLAVFRSLEDFDRYQVRILNSM